MANKVRHNLYGEIRRRSSLLVPLAVFLIAAGLLIPFYRYGLGPDGISYLSIAQQYVAGYWKEAVNAYWGPLYSWLIVPLLLVRIPVLLAGKLIQVAAGVLALFALWRMARRFDMSESLARVFLWIAAAMVLAFAMQANTADLIVTALLLLYVTVVVDPQYPSFRYAGAFCGFLGGFAYLAKGYAFFFFVVHFLVVSILHCWTRKAGPERARILLQFFAGSVIFCVISFGWMVVLRAKYHRWMLGTTGEYNFRLVGPESTGYPHLRHLMPPNSPHAITSWQDPSLASLLTWNPLASSSNLKHQIKLITINTKDIFRYCEYATLFFPALVLAYIVLCLNSPARSREWIYLLFTIVLFAGGYVLITIEDRYLWLIYFLILWIAFRSLDLLLIDARLSKPAYKLLLSVIVVSFLLSPVITLHSHFREDRNLYQWSKDIKASVNIKGRLASCADWERSAYVAFVLGAPYYGVPAPVPEADEVARELNPDYHPNNRSHADNKFSATAVDTIDYFLVWSDCSTTPEATRVAQAGEVQVVRPK